MNIFNRARDVFSSIAGGVNANQNVRISELFAHVIVHMPQENEAAFKRRVKAFKETVQEVLRANATFFAGLDMRVQESLAGSGGHVRVAVVAPEENIYQARMAFTKRGCAAQLDTFAKNA